MKDREILYVRAIADCKSITKAAEQLFIAQPSLTQALHRVEDEYGAEFFERGKSGLKLTEAGALYLDTAGKMQECYAQMEQELHKGFSSRNGHVNLGTTAIQGGVLLPEFVKNYRKCFPHVTLNLIEGSSTQLEQMVEDGQVDVTIIHRPFKNHELNYISIYKEPLFLAISPEDEDYKAMNKGREIPACTSEMLSKKGFILPNHVHRIRQIADNICSCAGITPNIVFVTSSVLTSLSMAGNGMGVAVVPRYLVKIYQKKFGFAVMKFPTAWNAKWEMVVAYRKNYVLPDLCKELIRILQETVCQMPEIFE